MAQKSGTRRVQAKEETMCITRQSAYSLFEEKGYDKSTMRELASRAGEGLNSPTFDIGRQSAQMDRLIDQLLSGIAVSSKYG